MPRPKRQFHATAALTTTPPPTLPASHTLARVVKAAGNNLYSVELPDHHTSDVSSAPPSSNNDSLQPTQSLASSAPVLVELPSRFRNTIWLKRGSFVVVDTEAFAERENKLAGQIVNVVREERAWRKMAYWPKGWEKKDVFGAEEDEQSEEESNMGKMPPGSDDETE